MNIGREDRIFDQLFIRYSNSEDLIEIERWLEAEKQDGIDGNFLCNWSKIERSYDEGNLLVYIDESTQKAVAFQLGRLLEPGILQVRHDYRNRGIGSALVDYCIEKAKSDDEPILHIQCKPSSSIPFWEKKGFELLGDGLGDTYAFQILSKSQTMPNGCPECDVEVKFLPEQVEWNSETAAIETHRLKGATAEAGSITLDQRCVFFDRALGSGGDIVVRVTLDGENVFQSKAKYPEAETLGIRKCTNGYFIDVINEAAFCPR